MAIRWAVADHSETSGLGSLIYAFFLFGGLGVITYFILRFLVSSSENNADENSAREIKSAEIYQESSFENSGEDELAGYRESIIHAAMEMGDLGISLQGIYGLSHTPEGWISVNDKILEKMPPKNYPSKAEWEKHLKRQIYS